MLVCGLNGLLPQDQRTRALPGLFLQISAFRSQLGGFGQLRWQSGENPHRPLVVHAVDGSLGLADQLAPPIALQAKFFSAQALLGGQ